MKTTTPAIRPALPEDVAAMSRVFAAAIEAKARDSYGPRERAAWAARGTPERFSVMLADDRNRLFVAASDAAIHGIAGLTGCELSLLYTAPDAAPGTGARLLAAVEGIAWADGIAGLGVTASRNALPFYLRHGYAVVRLATRPLPGGVALPVCLMAKALLPCLSDGSGLSHKQT
ncbi:GNAT family N-acetyltransferase [Solidesulfovibrio alcoholivorans]|uniref:GNAT family N-acetyltransferase n=1 Tax=Solidesulfovibrio alcoholivorans TaxID=81406 RepID=UPI000ACC284D|nr:GNAT family N-acetyltransferase [Solidesulfovibrio alcoholivorans]